MKTLRNIDIRLTDDLERQLLQEAIESQQQYALDRAIKRLFHKLVSVFKTPAGRTHQSIRPAH